MKISKDSNMKGDGPNPTERCIYSFCRPDLTVSQHARCMCGSNSFTFKTFEEQEVESQVANNILRHDRCPLCEDGLGKTAAWSNVSKYQHPEG